MSMKNQIIRWLTGSLFLMPSDGRFHRLLLLAVSLRVGGLLLLIAGLLLGDGALQLSGVALLVGAFVLVRSDNLVLTGSYAVAVLALLLLWLRHAGGGEALLLWALVLPCYTVAALGRRQALLVAALLLPLMALLGPAPAAGWGALLGSALVLTLLAYYIESARLGTQRLLKSNANSDPLTRVANRRHFAERVQAEIGRAKRHGHPMSLILFNADSFRLINAMYGHDVGDKALIHMAAVVNKALRHHDLLGHIAGKEFAVLLPETAQEGAMVVAEKIREGVAASPLTLDEGQLDLTLSLGVIAYSDEFDSLSLLFAEAGRRVQQAKSLGGNHVVPVEES